MLEIQAKILQEYSIKRQIAKYERKIRRLEGQILANICPTEAPEDRTETMENNNNKNKWTFSSAKRRHKPLDRKDPTSALSGTKIYHISIWYIHMDKRYNISENVLTLYAHNDRDLKHEAKPEKYKGKSTNSQKSTR